MLQDKRFGKKTRLGLLTLGLLAVLSCLLSPLAAQAPPLAVVDEPLPPIEAGLEVHAVLHAAGGVPPYVWSIAGGELPEGITLTPEGLLSGRPTKPGAFSVTLNVEDSTHPANAIHKKIHAAVVAALALEWLQPPRAGGDRIDGVVEVSNGSSDAFDLTLIVEATAENGRATAIGYEHFQMNPGATGVKIPFGNTLPHGAYVVNADAIAEIPLRHAILRQRLETPKPLQVTQ